MTPGLDDLDALPGGERLRRFRAVGPDDAVFDAALLVGALLFVGVVLVGRDLPLEAVVAVYLGFVACYPLYKALPVGDGGDGAGDTAE